MNVKERLEALIDRLLETKDLKEAQAIAVDLQWTVYEHLDALREEMPPPLPRHEDRKVQKLIETVRRKLQPTAA